MKRKIRNILITIVSIIAGLAALVGVATLSLNTPHVQQVLLRKATEMLTEKLSTRVGVDSVSVNLYVPSMALYGLCIDDQQGGRLLRMEKLTAEVSVESLWERRFVVKEVETDGLEARLVKAAEDSVPNYQFLIDALKKKDTKDKDKKSEDKGKKKWGLTLHPKYLRMKNTHINSQMDGKKTDVTMQQMNVRRHDNEYRFDIDGLHLTTDNGKPHRKIRKPKGGKFDAGHLNLTAALKGTVHILSKDSIAAHITDGNIQDPEAGIDISSVNLKAAVANRKTVTLTDLALKQGSTTLNVNRAHITLPDTTKGQKLAYKVENITGQVVLHDIAKPLVPALKEFHLPLQLNTRISGTADEMNIPQVQVSTNDKRLTLTAHGRIDHLRDKQELTVNFDVTQLLSKQGMAEKVINQFIVKKLMMNQLHQLGDISYKGHFSVAHRCENFQGRLSTRAGHLDFHFTIDDNNGRLRGAFSSPAVKVGQVMDMPKIGDVDCQADFDIDISKQRTAQIRRQNGGKLPIGTVSAKVNDCSYKRTHFRNIHINIKSDGANATGDILQLGNRRQISCEFIYNESDPKHKLRIKNPSLHFGKQKNNEEAQDSIAAKKKKEKQERKEEKQRLKREKKEKKQKEANNHTTA